LKTSLRKVPRLAARAAARSTAKNSIAPQRHLQVVEPADQLGHAVAAKKTILLAQCLLSYCDNTSAEIIGLFCVCSAKMAEPPVASTSDGRRSPTLERVGQ
jgi:hypothetical protein